MKERKILYQIKSLEKLIFRNLFSDMKEVDLFKTPTPTQHQIMEYILEHKNENVYQRDLENILNLRRATVSGVLKTMEKNQLIVRITDIKDTRIKKIILNEKAEKIFKKNEKKFEELDDIITQNIKKEDLDIFSDVLKKMKENIKNNI